MVATENPIKTDTKENLELAQSPKALALINDKAYGLKSLNLTSTPNTLRNLAMLLILILALIINGLIFIPWQQTVVGNGKIIIFSPMDRPQNIEAQIPGRIIKWDVYEGQIVKEGDIIAELSDIDSKFLDSNQVGRLEKQKEMLQSRRSAAMTRSAALEEQYKSLNQSRNVAIPTAGERAKQTEDRLRAAEQMVKAAEQNLMTSELNFKRIGELNEKGLRSNRDRELSELDFIRAKTELERAQAMLEIAKSDTTVGRLDQVKVASDTAATLNNIEASMASVQETMASINNDLLKLEIDLQNMRVRSTQQIIRAPRNGQIVRLLKVGAGETVKAGDVLAVIAPQTNDQAVELYVSDNDAPLVSVGSPVRLQFAGWPAIQFSGWPSIAVGTFGGRVAVIDPVDDGKSRYRIIVKADQELIASGKDDPWPDARYLRPGAEVSGWVMLNTVSLGFELWRQFNGFPPTIELESLKDKGKK
ncbi:MAG: HlyD family efflux transporter periplasmic adaptor subunit [Blastocatellia bacterium]|nr:HlyD family efflux transporter periplasmic adaptor subunit [Blastocatellia bacterium]